MTFKDVEKEYNCNITKYLNMFMNDDIQIIFKFPDYTYKHIMTGNEMIKYGPTRAEASACELAVHRYKKYNGDISTNISKEMAKAGNTLDDFVAIFKNPFIYPNRKLEEFKGKEPYKPKLEVNECYSISFDISAKEDVSVATVFKVRGNQYTHVGTFTGEEAEWMYNRITNIKI